MPTTPIEDLPEDWQKEVTDLRRQKDNFRKGLKDYQDKYAEAGELLKVANDKLDKFSELESSVGKLTTDLSTKDFEIAKIKATAAAKLDLSFADRLKGSTAEELQADALELAKQFGGAPAFVDQSQGQGKGNGGSPAVEPLNSGNFADNLAAVLQSMDDGDAA